MGRKGLWFLTSGCLVAMCLALPSSLVEEIKNSEIRRSNKVKRAQSAPSAPEENADRVTYFNKPTSAIKRGTNLKNQGPDPATLSEWDQDQVMFRNNQFNMDNVQSSLFNPPEMALDDKTIAEYEKGFRYGTNKDKIDEALENAVLKSELYGEPMNQYRYYGGDDRRKRRDVSKLRLKRNVDLTPEEMLALLTLYENNHSPRESDSYRQPSWARFGKNYGSNDQNDFDLDDNDETWLDGPVYPHASMNNEVPNNYLLDFPNNGPQPDFKGRWGGFDDAKKKRFIVAKKRTTDPTRMIRYLNGPNENDFNTLSKLLNNQRESKLNVPVYRRLIL